MPIVLVMVPGELEMRGRLREAYGMSAVCGAR